MSELNRSESPNDGVVSGTLEVDNNDVKIMFRAMSTWFLIAGYSLILIGILTILFPFVASLALEGFVGIAFLLVGLSHAFHSFQSQHWSGRLSGFLIASIFMLGGLSLFAAPMAGIQSIALIIGVIILVESLSKLIFSRKLQLPNPVLWIVDGCVGIVFAILILANWPQDAVWVVGLLIGIRIAFTGAILVAASRALVAK